MSLLPPHPSVILTLCLTSLPPPPFHTSHTFYPPSCLPACLPPSVFPSFLPHMHSHHGLPTTSFMNHGSGLCHYACSATWRSWRRVVNACRHTVTHSVLLSTPHQRSSLPPARAVLHAHTRTTPLHRTLCPCMLRFARCLPLLHATTTLPVFARSCTLVHCFPSSAVIVANISSLPTLDFAAIVCLCYCCIAVAVPFCDTPEQHLVTGHWFFAAPRTPHRAVHAAERVTLLSADSRCSAYHAVLHFLVAFTTAAAPATPPYPCPTFSPPFLAPTLLSLCAFYLMLDFLYYIILLDYLDSLLYYHSSICRTLWSP